MADIANSLRAWSATAGSNQPTDSTTIGSGLDDNLRQIQAVVRQFLASKGTNMASAATLDLSTADGYYIHVTGSTGPITSLGTEGAGISYWLEFDSTPTITHNGTSLILPGAADITAAAGDLALMMSEGSGNWRCIQYQRSTYAPSAQFPAGTVMVFAQTNAPTGWTKSSSHDDKALRVVTGSVSSGGATAFTSVFGSGKSTGSYTLQAADVPAHTHTLVIDDTAGSGATHRAAQASASSGSIASADTTGSSGGGGGHSHTLSLDLQYVDVIIATKD